MPQGKELELLETVRDKVPPEVFTTPYKNPVGGSAEAMRNNLREASRLLKEAGFEIRDRKLVGRDGKPVSVEFLIQDPGDERGLGFYNPNLEKLGIAVSIRLVDSVQYQNRVRSFDFDMVTTSWAQSISPGNEQRDFFSSQAADIPGSRNRPGIKNPAVDALIERIIFAPNREEQIAACKGDGSRPAVELLRRAAIQHSLRALRALGPVQSPRSAAEIWYLGLSGHMVVGRRQGGQSRQTNLTDFFRTPLLTRRRLLAIGAGALAVAGAPRSFAGTEAETTSHGLSVFGDLKYPADFKQFDYVNPNAPKGGQFSTIPWLRVYNTSYYTFNSLNMFVLKGDGAWGMDQTFASLMVRANDEPDALYGLVAKSVSVSPDKTVYRFTLRPEARFHDGSKLTAQDVAFSINTLKEKGHPMIGLQTRDLVKAEAPDDATVVVTFKENRARDVPLYVAGLPIFSRAYYANRPFEESSMDIPLGSGAYKVGKLEAGHYIEYDRVKDWWGANLPVSVGSNNFDTIRFQFYRDRDVAFQGFTARDYLFREEFTSRVWATQYDFPAAKEGRRIEAGRCRRNLDPARRAGSSTRGATSLGILASARR